MLREKVRAQSQLFKITLGAQEFRTEFSAVALMHCLADAQRMEWRNGNFRIVSELRLNVIHMQKYKFTEFKRAGKFLPEMSHPQVDATILFSS